MGYDQQYAEVEALFGNLSPLHHWEGPGPEHRHGDGPPQRHDLFAVCCKAEDEIR